MSLLRNGVLSTVAASDQTIVAMDADQYATGEGPCVDASLNGHWFHAESLDTETRRPALTPQARGLGIKAILSSPLRASEAPVGALNIYSRTAESFDIKAQETAAVFAQKASVILSGARIGVSETQMVMRFQEALRTREIISLAKGVIMEREGVDEDAAFTALLHLALHDGTPLRRRPKRWCSPLNSHRSGPNGDSMTEPALDVLDGYRQEVGLSHGELWLRYFELGGMSTGFDLKAFLYGVLAPTDHDHNVIAQALNERFAELGGDHPVPYATV